MPPDQYMNLKVRLDINTCTRLIPNSLHTHYMYKCHSERINVYIQRTTEMLPAMYMVLLPVLHSFSCAKSYVVEHKNLVGR